MISELHRKSEKKGLTKTAVLANSEEHLEIKIAPNSVEYVNNYV